ncbi:MAG TPA: MotA/TolQ/ExbB proton channel family protein [Chthoniobacteraceae bacterium]|nr:MotA/TolQ/ExbB proton channel family protein [Chthoniobacteraceae bacterium]
MKPILLSLLLSPLLLPAALQAQEEGAAGAAALVAQKTASFSLLDLMQAGGWAMIPLAIMSVLMVALILAFIFTLRPGSIASAHFMNTAEVLLKKRDDAALLAITNRHSELAAKVLQRTLEFATHNPTASFESIREIAQTEGASRAAALQNRITYLADIAVLSPMVGLLGTVFGMIASFRSLGSNVSEATRPILLANGVSEALIATGSGLIVGIIAMAFYGLFRNRVQSLISELERATTHLLALLATQGGPLRSETLRPARSSRPPRDTRSGGGEPPAGRRPSVSVDDEF